MSGGSCYPRAHQVAPAPSKIEAKDGDKETQSQPAANIDRVVPREEEPQRHLQHADMPGRNGETSAEHATASLVTIGPHENTQAASPSSSLSSGIEEQFPMFVMPIHQFLGLTELLPHQDLRRMNKLVKRDDSMETVIFVSHQWTSFDHPDHTGRQLRTLQRMFQRMLTGQVPEIDAPFVDKVAFAGKAKVAPHEWKGMLRNSYIWIDYAGVPQKEPASKNNAASGSDGR